MPPKGTRGGDILLADSTIFTTLFGGTESLGALLAEYGEAEMRISVTIRRRSDRRLRQFGRRELGLIDRWRRRRPCQALHLPGRIATPEPTLTAERSFVPFDIPTPTFGELDRSIARIGTVIRAS